MLTVCLAGQSTHHKMVVTDLLDTHCLIGLDFLTSANTNIDVKNKCLTSTEGSAPFLKQPKLLKRTSVVRSRKTVTIPPNTVMHLNCKVPGLDNSSSYSAFLEPKQTLLTSSGLVVQSSLCHTDGDSVPVKIINLSDEPTVLFKNKVLGSLYPVDQTCDKHIRRVTFNQSSEPEWRLHQRVNDPVALYRSTRSHTPSQILPI